MPPPRARATGRGPLRNLLAAAASVALHAAILLMILFALPKPPLPAQEPPTVTVQLVADLSPPAPSPAPSPAPPSPAVAAKPSKPKPPTPKPPAPARAAPRRTALASRTRPSTAAASPLSESDDAPAASQDATVSEAELAGAASPGSGGGGGRCDMAARLEAALRKDLLVRSAVASFAGKAIRVWDGDWVKSLGEDGKGLAAVREAMMWEIAFAPQACRSQPVRGLVVVSLEAPEGRVRLALGASEWRWTDLLASEGSTRR
jgi:hypothetical protein